MARIGASYMVSKMSFSARWQAAVANLQLQAERLLATANVLPTDVKMAEGRRLCPDPLRPLIAHMAAMYDYTTAMACVQELLREYNPGGP